jgi:hypothetical protein
MPAWKLIGLYAAWLIASAAIAIAAGGFVGIMADFLGAGSGTVGVVFDVVTALAFAFAALLPLLIRGRLARDDQLPP